MAKYSMFIYKCNFYVIFLIIVLVNNLGINTQFTISKFFFNLKIPLKKSSKDVSNAENNCPCPVAPRKSVEKEENDVKSDH